MKLPRGIPTSSIIEQDKGLLLQIEALYQKYISEDADLMINISFDARGKFMADLNMIRHSHTNSHLDLDLDLNRPVSEFGTGVVSPTLDVTHI